MPFRTTRRVEFHDTDMGGIMHFTGFFRAMEVAEHELLRDLSLNVVSEDEEGRISWPRVSAKCDFQSPAHFDDVLDIEVDVARLGEKSVTYRFRFSHDGRPVAEGEMTSVCCRIRPDAPPSSIPIPAEMVAKFERAL